jgi:hypothetical protein
MKKFDDRRLYLYFALITLLIAFILALISYYSILLVEPEIERLLSVKENISESYRQAYSRLRDPQIFARYENFDRASFPIKNILEDFDRRIERGESFTPDDRIYLEVLLERRIQGSKLGRLTVIFFLLLSLLGWVLYLYEVRKLKGMQ